MAYWYDVPHSTNVHYYHIKTIRNGISPFYSLNYMPRLTSSGFMKGMGLNATADYTKARKIAKDLNDIHAAAMTLDCMGVPFNILYQEWDKVFYGELMPLCGIHDDSTFEYPEFVLEHVTAPKW